MVYIILLTKYYYLNKNFFNNKKDSHKGVFFIKLIMPVIETPALIIFYDLHVEPEVHHITILYQVFFSFNS